MTARPTVEEAARAATADADIVDRLRDIAHRWGNHNDRREAAVEILQLRAQVARDNEHYNAVRNMSEKHRALWVEAQQECDRLREAAREMVKALEFYANPKRYEGPNQRPIAGDKFTAPDAAYLQDVTRDHGAIARAALSLAVAAGLKEE